MSELDELFGEGGGQPVPKLGLVKALLASGILISVLGMACITAPGGVLVLLAWMVVDKEWDRLDAGYLPETVRPQVELWRRITFGGVVFTLVLFVVQFTLICLGVYDWLFAQYLPIWRWVVGLFLTTA